MPTYEYACTECHHEWEEIQRISEPPVELCPACKKVSAQRLISAGNFILKGGGWYADLYSSPKPKANDTSKGNDSSGSSASKPAEKDSGGSKTETKSADSKVETKATSSTSTTPAT
jgi:putative FmdB family regulatory protein